MHKTLFNLNRKALYYASLSVSKYDSSFSLKRVHNLCILWGTHKRERHFYVFGADYLVYLIGPQIYSLLNVRSNYLYGSI